MAAPMRNLPHEAQNPSRGQPPPCLLLALSAEMRTLIYAYALTEASGITLCWHPGTSKDHKKPIMAACPEDDAYPINQLKYVNCQLYKETAGLEILYSPVIFQSETYASAGAIASFQDFVRHCAPRKLLWLRRVVLRENVDWTKPWELRHPMGWLACNMPSMLKTLRMCSKNPHMTVELELPGFGVVNAEGMSHPFEFLATGIALSRMFRSKDMTNLLQTHGSQTRAVIFDRRIGKILGKYREEFESVREGAQNLRLVTRCRDWDKNAFSDGMVRSWRNVARRPLPEQKVREAWVLVARRWSKEGV
jgi:hypothetical protein